MKIDMSPEAITERLRQVEELRRLCLSLGRRTHTPIEKIIRQTDERGNKVIKDVRQK